MAIVCIDKEWVACGSGEKCEFLCDTDADFANLPQACVGSTAVSIASGSVRIVNTQGVWVAFGG